MNNQQQGDILIKTALISGLVMGLLLVLMLLPSQGMMSQARMWLKNRFWTENLAGYRLATGSSQGRYHQLGHLLADQLEANRLGQLSLRNTAGSMENLDLLASGEADLALIQGALVMKSSAVSAIASLESQYVQILVPIDSPIREFRDLAGKTVSLGAKRSGFSALGQQVFSYFNLSPATRLVHSDLSRIEQDFQDGSFDAFFTVFALHAPLPETLMAGGAYRILPIYEAESVAGYIPGVAADTLPMGSYGPNRNLPRPGQTPFPCLTVNTLLVARSNLPGGAVKAILQNIISTDFIKAARLNHFSERTAGNSTDLPLHPAATAFYQRNAPISSDSFEIASFFLAAIVFLGGALSFLNQRNRERVTARRMRKIVPYFEDMLTFSKNLEQEQQPGKLKDLLHQMMSVQHRAEKEWLAGKLDTEHMENLYVLYGIRSANAFNKILAIQMEENQAMSMELLTQLQAASQGENEES